MPLRRPHGARPLLVLVLVVAAACRGGDEPAALAALPVPPDTVVPEPVPAREPAGGPVEVAEGPHEVTIRIEIGELPDGTGVAVEIRETVAGQRRHVVIDTPAGIVDQHVVTDDEHWWWLAPDVRSSFGDVEWIHIDVAEVERAGATLPDLVLDARRPLPGPDDVHVGDRVAGYVVSAVEHLGPDEVRAEAAGMPGAIVVRREALPPTTTVDLPRAATPMRDVPGLLGR